MNLKSVLLPVAAPVLLGACAATIELQRYVGANGATAYAMRCSGVGCTFDACYEKAAELCPGGYRIIDRVTGTVDTPSMDGETMTVPRYAVTVECK